MYLTSSSSATEQNAKTSFGLFELLGLFWVHLLDEGLMYAFLNGCLSSFPKKTQFIDYNVLNNAVEVVVIHAGFSYKPFEAPLISNFNHSCIGFIQGRKEQCLRGVDSCRKYAQRWDRIIELNNQLRLFFKDYTWINVFDSFQMTNSGMWEWYDDNIHHHLGSSGMGDMVFQYILNLICKIPLERK